MKTAVFDLETSNLNANFGILLCAVIKPWEQEPMVLRIDDYEGQMNSDDSCLVEDVVTELSKYTILVAHNGVKFDRPFLNTRATKWGLPILNPRGNMIDPVILARKHLRMSYNGLDSIAQYLQTEHQKTPVMGHLWLKATLDRDVDAMDEIVEHCLEDVYVLEEVMQRLVPYVSRINEWGG